MSRHVSRVRGVERRGAAVVDVGADMMMTRHRLNMLHHRSRSMQMCRCTLVFNSHDAPTHAHQHIDTSSCFGWTPHFCTCLKACLYNNTRPIDMRCMVSWCIASGACAGPYFVLSSAHALDIMPPTCTCYRCLVTHHHCTPALCIICCTSHPCSYT